MQNNKKLLTVFTPTYNRAHTLERTYESLCAQECRDFVWLIIDDGSSDDTGRMVSRWQHKDNGFAIRYIYKENGGMHTAHNVAYDSIDTELNVCIDSDDMMAPGAVKNIIEKWESVRDQGYAGIIGLDAYIDNSKKKDGEHRNPAIVGKGFPVGIRETTLSGYYASGGKGDKKLVYRTDVISKCPPYPVFDGEKFFSPSYKYRLIDEEYKLAVLDEVLCLVDYRDDGSTRNMMRQYAENPIGFSFWRKFCIEHPVSRKRLIIDNIHYVSSCLLAGKKDFIRTSPTKVLTLLACPAGLLLSKYIMYKAGKP